jgi:hypothetical protein
MLVVLLTNQKDYEPCTTKHVDINDDFIRGWGFLSTKSLLLGEEKDRQVKFLKYYEFFR